MGPGTGWNRVPTNRVVDLVGYGGAIAHGPLPRPPPPFTPRQVNKRMHCQSGSRQPVVRQNENPAQRVMPQAGEFRRNEHARRSAPIRQINSSLAGVFFFLKREDLSPRRWSLWPLSFLRFEGPPAPPPMLQ